MIDWQVMVPADSNNVHAVSGPAVFSQFTEHNWPNIVWSERTLTVKYPHHSVTMYCLQSRWGSHHPIHTNTHIYVHTLPPCCWRHRLWSTDARKFPALILLTFTVTRHFSAWRCSTHSVTDEALFASVETSLGAPAAHRSGFWPSRALWPHSANTPQNYGPLLVYMIDI